MARQGHGIIINMSSMIPFVFTFNPEGVETTKKINYTVAPNIGGAFKKRYFSGFESKEATFTLVCLDMESPTGVMEEIAFFEQLREPDQGLSLNMSLYGNKNFPPPQVLFQFGISYVPLVWDVLDVGIKEGYFQNGPVGGVLGIPKRCEISLSLGLVEDHPLNQANEIAKKASAYAAAAKSAIKEKFYKDRGVRKELPGIFSNQKGNTRSKM
jgi:hypothetical protein